MSKLSGPECAGQPSATTIIVDGYGSYKSSGPQLIVTTSVSGQQGDVHLSHQLALVTQILSGKIH